MSFGTIEKREKAVDFDESKASKNRIEAHAQVEKVGRKQTQAVDIEHCAIHVMLSQFFCVGL